METNASPLVELLQQWNDCHGAFYFLTAEDLHWHLQEQDWLHYSLQRAEGVPLLLAEASPKGVAAGVSAKTLWVSLYGKIPAQAQQNFALTLDSLAPRMGKTRLSFSGEEFHLVPGIPLHSPSGMEAIAEKLGCQLAEAVDFAGKLRTSEIQAYIEQSRKEAERAQWQLSTVETADEEIELENFLAKEFPGRWLREFRFWCRNKERASSAFWNVLRSADRQVVGFSRLGLRRNFHGGWCPSALRLPFPSGTVENANKDIMDSCLGPIGVASAERGKGAGKILLGLSLELLWEKNAERLCIDWTNAYNYYKSLGLTVVRNYRAAWKDY